MLYKLSRIIDWIQGFGNGSSNEFFGLKKYLNGINNENFKFIDVGANHGEFFDLIKKIKGSNVEAILIEPNPTLFNRLTEIYEKDNCQFINKVVGQFEQGSLISLKIPTDTKWNAIARVGDFVEDKFKNLEFNLIQIEGTSIDEIISEHKLSRIDLIKIDTEGHDFEVIKSMEHSLKNNIIQNFYFEFGPANISSKVFFIDIIQYLDSLKIDYEIYKFDLIGGLKKVEYSIKNEYFRGNTNYLVKIN